MVVWKLLDPNIDFCYCPSLILQTLYAFLTWYSASIQVDLLGDEVDKLLNLLEKIYIALDHYSPVLQHYPGVSSFTLLTQHVIWPHMSAIACASNVLALAIFAWFWNFHFCARLNNHAHSASYSLYRYLLCYSRLSSHPHCTHVMSTLVWCACGIFICILHFALSYPYQTFPCTRLHMLSYPSPSNRGYMHLLS